MCTFPPTIGLADTTSWSLIHTSERTTRLRTIMKSTLDDTIESDNTSLDTIVDAISTSDGTADQPDIEQKGGVTTHAPAVLLHSGPGTGKSRVLSARLAYVLQSGWMMPEDVVTLSFTNRDAKVIKEKVRLWREGSLYREGTSVRSGNVWAE